MSSQLVDEVGRKPSIQGCIIKARNRKGGDKWITQKENVKRFQCSVRQTFFGEEGREAGRLDERPRPTRSDNCRPENAGKSFGRQSYWYGIGYFR